MHAMRDQHAPVPTATAMRLAAWRRRLARGERWWAAEAVFAAAAFVLLSLAAIAAAALCRVVAAAPLQQPGAVAFALAAAGVVCAGAGLACLVEGPGLFRLVPLPARSLVESRRSRSRARRH
jgi:hypothetical protein